MFSSIAFLAFQKEKKKRLRFTFWQLWILCRHKVNNVIYLWFSITFALTKHINMINAEKYTEQQ